MGLKQGTLRKKTKIVKRREKSMKVESVGKRGWLEMGDVGDNGEREKDGN